MFETKHHCIVIVSDPPYYLCRHQCSRKKGYGPGGDYCKQHGKLVEAGRQFPQVRKVEDGS